MDACLALLERRLPSFFGSDLRAWLPVDKRRGELRKLGVVIPTVRELLAADHDSERLGGAVAALNRTLEVMGDWDFYNWAGAKMAVQMEEYGVGMAEVARVAEARRRASERGCGRLAGGYEQMYAEAGKGAWRECMDSV
jgi:hypothetical protein